MNSSGRSPGLLFRCSLMNSSIRIGTKPITQLPSLSLRRMRGLRPFTRDFFQGCSSKRYQDSSILSQQIASWNRQKSRTVNGALAIFPERVAPLHFGEPLHDPPLVNLEPIWQPKTTSVLQNLAGLSLGLPIA